MQPAAPLLLSYSSARKFESKAVEVLVRIPMRPPIGVIVELQSGCAVGFAQAGGKGSITTMAEFIQPISRKPTTMPVSITPGAGADHAAIN